MKTMSQAAALADCPETLDEARAIIAQLEKDNQALRRHHPINTHVRLFDLVRYARTYLFDGDLITAEEYAQLCSYRFPFDPDRDSPSPRRLEDYDELRRQLKALQEKIANLETKKHA